MDFKSVNFVSLKDTLIYTRLRRLVLMTYIIDSNIDSFIHLAFDQ